jgi:DNA-binding transcriptional ArsR family regulator
MSDPESTTGCCRAKDPEVQRLAELFRALSHPARLGILEELAARPDACCGDIVDCLPLAQSTVSQHLQVLKETGLVSCEVRGRTCRYSLNLHAVAVELTAAAALLARLASLAGASASEKD